MPPDFDLGRDWWSTLGQPQYDPVQPSTRRGKPRSAQSRERVQLVADRVPRRSWRPGGAKRSSQRSGDRVVPPTRLPVNHVVVLEVLRRPWFVSRTSQSSIWRVRGLAVLAVALAVPRGTTTVALASMLPADIRALSMPPEARRWVNEWLAARQRLFVAGADCTPWTSWPGSNGKPRALSWAATRTLDRAGAPGWRLSQLLRAARWVDVDAPRVALPVSRSVSTLSEVHES
jgi:hypothetical protein